MANNMMSEESRRRFTSSINSLKELLARSQQQDEPDLLKEGSVTEPFGDILLRQQVENTCQSIPNGGIEQA